jgi:pimeloyl-ACP methyl ester carboxylesterase
MAHPAAQPQVIIERSAAGPVRTGSTGQWLSPRPRLAPGRSTAGSNPGSGTHGASRRLYPLVPAQPRWRRLLTTLRPGSQVGPVPPGRGCAAGTRRPGNARTVASLMHAIDRFRRPRPESVLTSAELAAIAIPAIFILGSDDPYLSIERARPSIDLIHGARLYEVPGGHAPWLVDAQHAAELIATHSHLATGPHLSPALGERRQANAST